jgi:hypothetical protein
MCGGRLGSRRRRKRVDEKDRESSWKAEQWIVAQEKRKGEGLRIWKRK